MSQLELIAANPPGPAPATEAQVRLARELAGTAFLGTSSWSFPGWSGIVYDRRYSKTQLAREGLRAYSAHPLLNCVGIDRTFYAPLPARAFADYAHQVPTDFRFLVKAPEACTLARFPEHRRYGPRAGLPNPLFLDAAFAAKEFVEPALEGLGQRAGPLVFQFPPQESASGVSPADFAQRLGVFLSELPAGPSYAVELRTRSWLTPSYRDALTATGVAHCLTVHPTMPGLDQQTRLAAIGDAPLLVVRWMLGAGLSYERARSKYAPFDRLVEPDPGAREQIAQLCASFVRTGRPVFVIANNKAEGSAPLSVFELAQRVAALRRSSH